jgi:hypothetical protein
MTLTLATLCHYAECRVFFVVMLSVVMMYVVKLNVARAWGITKFERIFGIDFGQTVLCNLSSANKQQFHEVVLLNI